MRRPCSWRIPEGGGRGRRLDYRLIMLVRRAPESPLAAIKAVLFLFAYLGFATACATSINISQLYRWLSWIPDTRLKSCNSKRQAAIRASGCYCRRSCYYCWRCCCCCRWCCSCRCCLTDVDSACVNLSIIPGQPSPFFVLALCSRLDYFVLDRKTIDR